jgi:UDP-N-acetylglucosamine--N-acetylmuramyl-(pentapeptide) pyrophosphoryl-undecaprenol N-acetylglucosamine transferase
MITDADVDLRTSIFAGKFRRYDRPLWQSIIDVPTNLKNFRDLFYVMIGTVQAWFFLRRFKPDAVFVKGGFVSVPVGLASALRSIPIVTHDSDMTPGLANKLVGRWAKFNAVASERGEYPYVTIKKKVVGVPISNDFYQEIDDDRQLQAKEAIGAGEAPMVLVVGGSLGSKSINTAMISIASALMEESLEIFHITGAEHYNTVSKAVGDVDTQQGAYKVIEFIDDPELLLEHYVAADLVISRAGATNTAEIAGLKKPAVIIPGQHLSDQQANARELERQHAAIILQDEEIADSPQRLFEAIDLALEDEELSQSLSDNIANFSEKQAADLLAKLIVEATHA